MRFTHLVQCIGFVAIMALTGCGNETPISFITMNNTAPQKLDAQMNIKLHMQAGNSDPSLIVTFIAKSKDTPVKLVAGETVVCDNASMIEDPFGVWQSSVPIPTDNSPVNCTYTSHGGSAQWSMALPAPLTLISPQNNATIPRSHATPIRYHVQVQGTIYILANATGTHDRSVYIQSSNTGEYALDTTSLASGISSVTVDQVNGPIQIANTAFHSASLTVDSSATITVHWQ